MLDDGPLDIVLFVFIFLCLIMDCTIIILRRRMLNNIAEYNHIQDAAVAEVAAVTADDILVEPDSLFVEVDERMIDKYLTDQHGVRNCIICSDEIHELHPMLECKQCAKYVGHTTCIKQWITTQIEQRLPISCPYCRQL
jgi:hypothetical protein